MSEEMNDLIRQYIKDNLRLEVRTDSIYNGGVTDAILAIQNFGEDIDHE